MWGCARQWYYLIRSVKCFVKFKRWCIAHRDYVLVKRGAVWVESTMHSGSVSIDILKYR